MSEENKGFVELYLNKKLNRVRISQIVATERDHKDNKSRLIIRTSDGKIYSSDYYNFPEQAKEFYELVNMIWT